MWWYVCFYGPSHSVVFLLDLMHQPTYLEPVPMEFFLHHLLCQSWPLHKVEYAHENTVNFMTHTHTWKMCYMHLLFCANVSVPPRLACVFVEVCLDKVGILNCLSSVDLCVTLYRFYWYLGQVRCTLHYISIQWFHFKSQTVHANRIQYMYKSKEYCHMHDGNENYWLSCRWQRNELGVKHMYSTF